MMHYTWCGGCPPFVRTHNQDWQTHRPPLVVWHSRTSPVAFPLPKISKNITKSKIFYDTPDMWHLFALAVYTWFYESFKTSAFWMALGGRCSLGNANAPPSTGWQQNPGRLFTTSRALFTLWTKVVLMFCVSCRRERVKGKNKKISNWGVEWCHV